MRWHIPVIQPAFRGQGDEVGFLVTRINDERGSGQRGLSQELLKENRNFVPETVPDAVFFYLHKYERSFDIAERNCEMV